jgi:hypothetical protein
MCKLKPAESMETVDLVSISFSFTFSISTLGTRLACVCGVRPSMRGRFYNLPHFFSPFYYLPHDHHMSMSLTDGGHGHVANNRNSEEKKYGKS